jgi:hypothetical protein
MLIVLARVFTLVKARFRTGLGSFPTAMAVLLMFNSSALAHIFIVTDTNDTTNPTSLRGAIIAANQRGGENTILLGEPNPHDTKQWTYQLTISGADEDAGLTGDLDITQGRLEIIGRSRVTINATGLGDRVFQVCSNAFLKLENLNITGGSPGAGSGIFANGEPGGAILNAGTLFMNNCVITNNSSGGGQSVEGNGGGTGGGDGGGIYNSGSLTMENCLLIGNSAGNGVDGATGGNGGGIRNDGYCLINNCIICMNQSGAGGGPAGNAIGVGGGGGNGGGIYNTGTMILNQCNVAANFSGQGSSSSSPGIGFIGESGTGGGSGGNGGGVFNVGQMQLDSSAIYSNETGGGGGGGGSSGYGGGGGDGGNGAGVFNAGEFIGNTSTISTNLCGNGGTGGGGYLDDGGNGGPGGAGGGVCNIGFAKMTSCTIAMNQAGTGGNSGNSYIQSTPPSGGPGGDGGGIYNNAPSTNAVIRNTLIALNTVGTGGAGGTNTYYTYVVIGYEIFVTQQQQIGNPGTDGVGFDLAGDFDSQSFNLVSIADGSTGFINQVNDDQVGCLASPIDPLIGPLQMNGGFTPTHALSLQSPAINQGKCFGIHFDQRGRHRPYVFPNIPIAPGGDGSDIGAFELTAGDLHFNR